jgi:hypothetical protein
MQWNCDNPCFNCQFRLPSGEIRKGPCCFDLCLEVTEAEYNAHFSNKPHIKTIGFFDRSNQYIQTIRIIEIKGDCPHHQPSTGKCSIETNKPQNCLRAQALKFELCVKAVK